MTYMLYALTFIKEAETYKAADGVDDIGRAADRGERAEGQCTHAQLAGGHLCSAKLVQKRLRSAKVVQGYQSSKASHEHVYKHQLVAHIRGF